MGVNRKQLKSRENLDVEGHTIRLAVEASGVFSRQATGSLPGTEGFSEPGYDRDRAISPR